MTNRIDLSNRWRTRFIWHRVDSNEEVKAVIWLLKVRPESRMTPRSLADGTGTKSLPKKDISGLESFFNIY